MMKKIIGFFIFVVFQSQSGWTQSIEQKILGNWELLDYDLREENEGDQQKPSGVIWIFKDNHVCEERSDPSNPNNVTIYEYKISRANCETGTISAEFYYVTLTNKTVLGDNYCFLIDIYKIDDSDIQDYLSLYSYGAIQPNILIRK